MKTFCFWSLVLFALAISVVPTKSSDSMTDVTAYAYTSEWTEYVYDPDWPGDLWYTVTHQEAIGGVYASHFIQGSYHANASVSEGSSQSIPLTYYGHGIDRAAKGTAKHLYKTSSECGGTGSANASITGASSGGTDSDSDSCFDYF
ncbi:hypothetical protein J5I95_06095 [Candidatus Poribacteria bacterium]|nr:hypothetical protein [Candidatus Poribacteria bacterium]